MANMGGGKGKTVKPKAPAPKRKDNAYFDIMNPFEEAVANGEARAKSKIDLGGVKAGGSAHTITKLATGTGTAKTSKNADLLAGVQGNGSSLSRSDIAKKGWITRRQKDGKRM